TLAIAFIFFGVSALIFWLILSDQVIDPIEKLTRYGERVTRAETEAQADRKTILPILQRRDQFGRLTDTLLQAEDDIRSRLLELTTLNKTSAAVVSTLNTEQVIDSILDEIQRLLSVKQCALLVVNKASSRLEVRASRELSPTYPQVIDLSDKSVQNLPAVRAINSGQIIQVPDLASGENFLAALSAARSVGYRSGLIIPLKAPHIPGAVLAIYRSDAQRFSQREISLAANFANHAAIALEHAMLFSLTDAELQKQVQFLSALNQIGRTVSQSLVMDDILNNAMNAVIEVMTADACWIYLFRSENEEFLRLRAHQGLPAQLIDHVQMKHVYPGEGAIGWVAQHGQPLVLDELNLNQIGWTNEPLINELRWRSLAAVPLIAEERVMGVLGLAANNDRAFHYGEVNLLQAIGDQIAIAVVNARLYRRSREVATLEERNRMAREIHDTLAQGFTGILVQLQAAERLSSKNPEKALFSLQEARELAQQSLQEARRSVYNLRPTILEELHLDEAIARQIERFQVETGLKADFLLDGYPAPLTPDVEQNLYRITQEALTNVQRHAHASSVWVALSYQPQQVSLRIVDDGCGLKQASSNGGGATGPHKSGHFGLVGIQERARLMGGLASFESPPAGGTQIKVEIPR
ncbi:MAG TPA: GAF domain-containing protein, partial [Anaerolineae bacterium]|nr:GAF domain-containing protein [Anaerolineae bacterium]